MRKFEKVFEDAILPKRETKKSAGYDLTSIEDVVVPPMGRVLIKTGLTVKMDANDMLEIRSRSGLAFKHGIIVLNSPGTVDADYYPREIGVLLYNTTNLRFEVKKGDRIAQAVFTKYYKTTDDDAEGEREGGFGSTGK